MLPKTAEIIIDTVPTERSKGLFLLINTHTQNNLLKKILLTSTLVGFTATMSS